MKIINKSVGQLLNDVGPNFELKVGNGYVYKKRLEALFKKGIQKDLY
jgi:hypothetical protein